MIIHGLDCPLITGSSLATITGVHYIINSDGWCWRICHVGQAEPDVLLLTENNEVTDMMNETLYELGSTMKPHNDTCPGNKIMREVK